MPEFRRCQLAALPFEVWPSDVKIQNCLSNRVKIDTISQQLPTFEKSYETFVGFIIHAKRQNETMDTTKFLPGPASVVARPWQCPEHLLVSASRHASHLKTFFVVAHLCVDDLVKLKLIFCFSLTWVTITHAEDEC